MYGSFKYCLLWQNMNCSRFAEREDNFFFAIYVEILPFHLGGNRLHVNSLSFTFIIVMFILFLFSK